MAYIDNTRNIPKFGGNIWYVNKDSGSDSNNGRTPDKPFETIGQGITTASAGDALIIKAGTYTETGLDVNKNALELWFEIGAVLDPASGTALTVSGNSCRVTCREGALKITPAAGATGVLVTGNFCYLAEIRVACGSSAAIGFDIGSADGDSTDGSGADLRRCRCSSPLTAAFKIQADKVKLEDCCTGGDTGDSSIGFHITNSCDKTRIINCGSQGNETAGLQIDTGCTNGCCKGFSSGGGDGKFINNAVLTNWIISDLHFQGDDGDYNSPVAKLITFTAAGGQDSDGKHWRVFKVTGCVRIIDLGFHVTTVIPNTSSNANFELIDANGQTVDITATDNAADMDSLVEGAVGIRNAESTEPIDIGDPDSTPATMENTAKFSSKNIIDCVASDDADTYIALILTAALASGAVIVGCRYLPLTPDGFLEPA